MCRHTAEVHSSATWNRSVWYRSVRPFTRWKPRKTRGDSSPLSPAILGSLLQSKITDSHDAIVFKSPLERSTISSSPKLRSFKRVSIYHPSFLLNISQSLKEWRASLESVRYFMLFYEWKRESWNLLPAWAANESWKRGQREENGNRRGVDKSRWLYDHGGIVEVEEDKNITRIKV